jgi:AraC family transcriptional regulator
MDARPEASEATRPAQNMTSFRRETEIFSAAQSMTSRSSPADDPMVLEACGLLEDVRLALDCDLVTASKAAGCLAALLARGYSQDFGSAAARGGLAPWQKRAVRKHIDDRLPGPVRVGDLAKLISLSPSYFSRAFRASFGERPHDYIMRTRIERARTLMLTTPLSLSQIALACGLVDQAHLCRCFRQATGTTPGAWRHNHVTGPNRRPGQ